MISLPRTQSDRSSLKLTNDGAPLLSQRRRPFSSILADTQWLSLLVFLLCWSTSGAETCNRLWLDSSPRCHLFRAIQVRGGSVNKLDFSEWNPDTEKCKNDIINELKNIGVNQNVMTKTIEGIGRIMDDCPKVYSSDPKEVMAAGIRIVGQLSHLLVLAVPAGPIVAKILGPLCAYTSKVLLSDKDEGSLESRLKDVIDKSLDKYRQDDLGSKSWAVFERLQIRMEIISKLIVSLEGNSSKNISEFARNMVSGSEFLTDGIFQLEVLWFFIDKKMREAKDEKEGIQGADLLLFYVTISLERMSVLNMISHLYQMIGAETLVSTVRLLISRRIEIDRIRLAKLFCPPNLGYEGKQTYNHVYRAIHSKNYTLIESCANAITGEGGFKGELIRISMQRNGKKYWLSCNEVNEKNAGDKYLVFQKDENKSTLFRYFKDEGLLLSCNNGLYVFPEQAQNIRCVKVWSFSEYRARTEKWIIQEDDSSPTIQFQDIRRKNELWYLHLHKTWNKIKRIKINLEPEGSLPINIERVDE